MSDKILSKEEADKLLDSLDFEEEVYRAIAKVPFGSSFKDSLKIVACPHPDGYFLKREDISFYVEESRIMGYKLLFRVQYRDYFVVFDKDDITRVGLIPIDPNGFQC